VAVGGVTPLPTDVVTTGVITPRFARVHIVAVEGTDAEVMEGLALPDETKVPCTVREVLQVPSGCSLPASSFAVCTDVTGVTEAEEEVGASRIGPIGARLARDPIFTVIPLGVLFTCNCILLQMSTAGKSTLSLPFPEFSNRVHIQQKIGFPVIS